MSTAERSVAEIIGWEYIDSPHEERMVRTPDGQLWYITKKPTVDDLLAWLREQGCGYDAFDHDGGHMVQVVGPNGSLACDPQVAPTFLAALEAAVRTVAGES